MAIRSRNESGAVNSAPKPLKRRKLNKKDATKKTKPSLGEAGLVINKITKNAAPGTVRCASDSKASFGRLRTGILALDLCLGGGWAYSRGVMIYGERSAGKSTIALISIAKALEDNPDSFGIYIDIEGSFDSKWAAKLGVDLERLHIVEPDSGEQAVDLAQAFLRANNVSIIVTDSIAFLTPSKEVESSAEDNQMGKQALLVGRYIRMVNSSLLTERKRGHYPLVMHLNQFRMKIGLVFGDPRTIPGGKALEFATSQQVLITNKEHKGSGDNKSIIAFNEHTVQITKNKTGGRLREGKFKFIRDESEGFNEGYIDQTKTIINFAKQCGLYSGGGSSHTLEGIGKFKSHDEIGKYFYENQDVQYDLCGKIITHFKKAWDIT